MDVTLPVAPSPGLQIGFIALSLAVAAGFAAGTRRWALTAGWLALTGALSASGALVDFSLPPRLFLIFFPGLFALSWLAWRSDWWRAPLWLLVGAQAFRIPVELLIHQAAVEGVAPPQLTWPPVGLNADVLTGLTALALAPLAGRAPRWLLHGWNLLGAGLLVNVVTVAVLSLPTPLQRIEPDNVWVAFFPFTWLPTILVMAAWLGHALLLRRLLADTRG